MKSAVEMGDRQLRSADEYCYICTDRLEAQGQDEEHVVPKSLFNPDDRQGLIKLPAHRLCNGSFSKDDEYFRLCMTVAARENQKARKLWNGPVLRGVHRPESRKFKSYILNRVKQVEVRSEAGLILGTAPAMLQDPRRVGRVVMRIARGLYSKLTGNVLPVDWPLGFDLMKPWEITGLIEGLGLRFYSLGNGTFLYDWKHLEDDREGFFHLIFYDAVHFWCYTGEQFWSRLRWYRDSQRPASDATTGLLLP